MAKPTSKPNWTVGNPSFGSVTIEPSAGKKLNGWAAAERPPHQFMNWLFYNLGEWIDYFEAETDSLQSQKGIYDASIGTNGTHANFAALVADADYLSGAIKNILVVSDQAISAPVTLALNDLNIEFKPGVALLKGIGANKGLIITGERVRIMHGRFANFSAPGDIAIELALTSKYCMVKGNYFLNNDSDVNDLGTTNLLSENIDEV